MNDRIPNKAAAQVKRGPKNTITVGCRHTVGLRWRAPMISIRNKY